MKNQQNKDFITSSNFSFIFYAISFNLISSKHESAACNTSNSEDANEIGAQKRKIQDDDEACMDPLKLAEPCANEVMTYLTGGELLNAMMVSKEWRDFIRVRSLLMDKISFKPKREINNEYSLIKEIFSEETKRNYKHMEASFELYKAYSSLESPIALHASTLKTLVLGARRTSVTSCQFPKLRKMTISYELPRRVLEQSKFPALTHLRIHSGDLLDFAVEVGEIYKMLHSFPNLTVLFLDIFVMRFDIFEDVGGVIEELQMTDYMNQPKIKAIQTSVYFSCFIKQYQSTLETLVIDPNIMVRNDYLYEMIAEFKVLKRLLVSQWDMTEKEEKGFELNDSIELLEIFWIADKGVEDSQKCLQNLLLALPSLKGLRLPDRFYTEETLQFIGEIF